MYLDYIPEDSDLKNKKEGEYLDFVPEPKPEFKPLPEVAEEVQKKPVKKVSSKKVEK